MEPDVILEETYQKVLTSVNQNTFDNTEILEKIELVSRNISNRAGVRLVLACSLAKVFNPEIDIRKPYTEIGDEDSFSGRSFDEKYITPFIISYELPCNPTTAFLTPALRNRNTVLTPNLDLSGRPKEVYVAMLSLLNDVYQNEITAQQLLLETIRQLVLFRDEKKQRMASLIATLKSAHSDVPLSSEQIIIIVEQHLATKGASRLPVLIVSAAYLAVQDILQETILPLEAHNAADSQTHAIGDVQVTLKNDDNVVTCYEMKMKRITISDIDIAVQEKLTRTHHIVDNFIFITTDIIEPTVSEYAKSMYEQIGIEMVILDCIGFLRHFLHLFHRKRMFFLEKYQELVLAEPDSAVSQPLKEVFLSLRHAAESD